MPKVLNKHTASPLELAGAVYVGRPSKFGNPFKMKSEADRQRVITEFEYHLPLHIREAAKQELRGKNLVCFCAPKPCHADVLLRIANEPTPPKEG